MRRALAVLVLLVAPTLTDRATAGDTLFVNARIITMDPARPTAEAMLVRHGVIAALGSRDEVERARDGMIPEAEACGTVDLAGRHVLPGLIDAHGHLQGLGAFGLGRLDLSGARSFADVVSAVRERVASVKPGEWILGGRWDHESWVEKVLPTHAALSAAAPANPVWLRRVDGHAGIANAEALRLAGITLDTPSPPGGEIIRDAAGQPTGVLIDNAMRLLDAVLPESSATSADLLLKAQEMCLSVGLTGVHDMGVSPAEARVYRELEEQGRLKLRVYALIAAPYAVRFFEENEKHEGPRLSIRAVKAYMDGAMGSRGAWLLEPYADRPTDDAGRPYTGLAVSDPAFIEDLSQHALDKGYQLCVHAIGDRANREVLDAFERALGAQRADHRFRMEHAQLLSEADIPRFARLGVIASMQPTHCTSDMRWVEARVGPERAKGAYAWASLLEAGATIAGGSDFPVESHNPFLGVYAAVTRQDLSGNPPEGWRPEQRVSRQEALRMFTTSAAYAGFAEDRLGSLAPGKQADFIVVDRDVMTCPARDIAGTRVLRTVIAGETVYEGE